MNQIHKLDSDLINQIAAGEVIDRPSSVLKELLENSLDAESTKIEIIINNGGRDLIQIKDNGTGISKNNIKIAFTRHATSKIKNIEDLNNINTLGFRGEALPSIASISKVTIISSMDNKEGHKLIIHGGKEKAFEPSSSIKGTNIKVENIFYNTPARRKFLKKSETEQTHINKILRRFLINRYDVHFKLISNNKIIYDLPQTTQENRLDDIYGNSFSKSLINIDNKNLNISGYVGNLSLIKQRPGEQYLYLNGRYIQSRILNSSIYSSYQSLIKRGEYPFFMIFLNMPNEQFDINVHPAKLEVRFKNEWNIYNYIKSTISNSLKDILNVIPEYHVLGNRLSFNSPTEPSLNFPSHSYANFTYSDNLKNNNINNNLNINNQSRDTNIEKVPYLNYSETQNSNSLESISEHIWQIHNKYLITEIIKGLIIIDQHVAHERVLFEEAKKAIEGNGINSQTILFPQKIKLLPEEFEKLIEITHYLNQIGFRFKEISKNTILIEGIPPNVKWGNESNIINEILSQYISINTAEPTYIENICALYACKSAIKAGDPLTQSERKYLIDSLFATDHPYYCPHGRPIIINLSINDLDERFERH